jgi:hypothetical protein
VYDSPQRWSRLTEDERTAMERNGLPFTVLANPALRPVGNGGTVSFYEGCLTGRRRSREGMLGVDGLPGQQLPVRRGDRIGRGQADLQLRQAVLRVQLPHRNAVGRQVPKLIR